MEKTTKHIFSVNDFIFIPDLTTQIAIFGFHGNNHDFIIKNHILMFKMHVYRSRSDEALNLKYLINFTKQT